MTSTICCNRTLKLLIGIAAIATSGAALADPPTRVARLGYIAGAVSYSPAGENDWVEAPLNRPLTTGDRLWADADAQDEMQIGSAAIRMSSNTSVTLLNLDDRIAQLQLSQGTLNVRVRRLRPIDVFEIDTPNLAFSLRQPGDYRISVDADGNATTVAVRRGQAEVNGEGAAYMVESAQSYRFAGTGLHEYQSLALPAADGFDRWSAERDRRVDNSASARYVSPDMIGYEDLDEHGSWRSDNTYGSVWMPSQVAADWAPYHDGRWAWVDPWGWTWVDNASWGFAVSHYGRWVNMDGGWGWVPGPMAAQAVYAPALVAFVGGSGFTVAISGGNVAGVAWFPLGPQDVYRPAYHVSLNYFASVNSGSTSVNHTNITNVYNNTNITNVTYVNRTVPGAVVAVTATAFTQSQPVSRSAVKLTQAEIGKAQVAPMAAVVPVAASVKGAAASSHAPPAAVLARPVVVKTAPPATPVSFAAKQSAMTANPGKPLEPATLAKMNATPAAPAPQIKLAQPTQAVAPISKAPPSIAAPKSAPAAAVVVAPNKQEHVVAPATPSPAMRVVQQNKQEHVAAPATPSPAMPVVQQNKQERAVSPTLPAEATPHQRAVAAPPAPAMSPTLENAAKQAEKPVASRPQEQSPNRTGAVGKVDAPVSNVKPTAPEPVPHPVEHVMTPHEPVQMPQHEPTQMPRQAPTAAPTEAPRRELAQEPRPIPAPTASHAPASPPVEVHAPAAPAPRPEAAKHEVPPTEKASAKKAEEDKLRQQ